MGLDMSIVRSAKDTDLGQLYAVRDAVVNGMGWYLGDDKEKRYENYLALKQKALCLNSSRILSDANITEEARKYLSGIDAHQFSIYLSHVIGSIEDFTSKNNTHMGFDWDLLPGITVIDSCSWNMKDIFEHCAIPSDNPDGETIVELDLDKIKETSRKWQKKGFKLKLAKWIGYFFYDAGSRMTQDFAKDLGLNDCWVDIDDLLYYRESLDKVAKFLRPDYDRLWLVSSY